MNKKLIYHIIIFAFTILNPILVKAEIIPQIKRIDIWAYGNLVNDSTTLETKQNNLRFYCILKERLPLDSLNFEFMLEGYNSYWETSIPGGWYYYNDLAPGSYTFKARCSYKNGEWSPVYSHSFKIKTPWWRSGWAYLMYITLSLSLIFYIFHLLRERLRLYNQLTLEQASNRFRFEFVSKAGRDFRTPLTVINSTIENLSSKPDSRLSRTNIRHLKNSSRQLMQMVENLLEYREIGETSYTSDNNDVIEMADIPINEIGRAHV